MGVGQIGEICVQTPCLLKEYMNRPEVIGVSLTSQLLSDVDLLRFFFREGNGQITDRRLVPHGRQRLLRRR